MTPRNAIAILRQVEQNWVANGADHQNMVQAINTLEGVVAVSEQSKTAAPNAPAVGSEEQPENGSEPTGEQDDAQPDTNS